MNKNLWRYAVCILLTFFATVFMVLVIQGMLLQKFTGNVLSMTQIFRVVNLLKNHYNGEVDNQKLYDGALRGLVDSVGDPYTVYLDREEYKKLHDHTVGTFGGIGIVYTRKNDEYVVISALENNPGALAGIKSGDVILSVDDVPVKTLNMQQVSNKIRGEEGTEVGMELRSKDGSVKKVRIVRRQIANKYVIGKLLPGTQIGYIRIAMFNERTGADFAELYSKLEQEGMEALLLDLRGNPGGVLQDGVRVAGMLVPKGPIVSVVYKDGSKIVEQSSLERVKYPLAVLIDNGTASASEIVAGAVKDTGAGKLFGEKSFGKGSVQSVYKLTSETAVKITTAKYFTPSGTSIHNVGIEPDIKVELPENAVEDVQLKTAEKYLLEKLQNKK